MSSALLRILEKKGSVPEKCMAYISSQKNMDRLNQLLDLAVASETVAEFEKKAGFEKVGWYRSPCRLKGLRPFA